MTTRDLSRRLDQLEQREGGEHRLYPVYQGTYETEAELRARAAREVPPGATPLFIVWEDEAA